MRRFLAAVCWTMVAVAAAEEDPGLALVDSLWVAHETAAAHAAVDSLLPLAERAGDEGRVAALRLRRGSMFAALGDGRAAEGPLLAALAHGEAERDTVLICGCRRWLGVALSSQGRMSESCEHYRTLRRLASAAGLRAAEAWGAMGVGYCAIRVGDLVAARTDYDRARRVFADLDLPQAELFALNAYGNACNGLGDYAAALECYRRTADLAREMNNLFLQGAATNNLGTLDVLVGDPGYAVERFEAAATFFARDGHRREELNSRLNVALCVATLGRFGEADVLLTEIATAAAAAGFRDLAVSAEIRRAGVRGIGGDPAAAVRGLRRVLAADHEMRPDQRAEAVERLAGALAALDSAAAGLAVIERQGRALVDRLDTDARVALLNVRGRLLVDQGSAEAGLRDLRAAADEAHDRGLVGYQLQALPTAAAAARTLGDEGLAAEFLFRARDVWRHERVLPSDPEWREIYGSQARLVATELAGLILEMPGEDRIRRAFDSLQEFKARTLHERMLGPTAWRENVEPVTLAVLQREVLAPGEVLLDCSIGPERSLVFAVTRDTVRVVELGGEDEVGGRLRRYHELLAAPGTGGRRPGQAAELAALETTTDAVRSGFLAVCADLLGDDATVVFCPDGPWHLLPLAQVLEREVVNRGVRLHRVPSATILATVRNRPDPGPAPSRILALAGRVDDRGRSLPGVDRELAILRRYGAVEAAPRPVPGAWSAADVLHFAAHATVTDEAPWRSRIDLDAPEAAGATACDAASIAALRLSARLTVLASCETAGGRILSGEGVQGLASAFLAAGVPTVLATLWAVDDAATAALVAAFYAELARGATAAAALRSAQRELAGSDAWADPYFWSGFVLVGDGATTVPVRALRRAPVVEIGLVIAVAGSALATWWWIRRRRSGGAS